MLQIQLRERTGQTEAEHRVKKKISKPGRRACLEASGPSGLWGSELVESWSPWRRGVLAFWRGRAGGDGDWLEAQHVPEVPGSKFGGNGTRPLAGHATREPLLDTSRRASRHWYSGTPHSVAARE